MKIFTEPFSVNYLFCLEVKTKTSSRKQYLLWFITLEGNWL